MSVNFKVIERGQPGVAGGGDKKFYALPVMSGEITLDGLTNSIEKISTVSGADIRAVLYSLIDVMENTVSNGQIVRLGELGSLRVSFSSEGKEAAEDINAACITKAKVIFSPGKKLKNLLKNLEFKKS